MLAGEVDRHLARAMRPWVLGAWIFLTLGITAGSYWAYYELGWGGWWFWDPVENASLMPWLAATALLHSVAVLAARNALKAWTMLLAVIAFTMSMVGTFLVRSRNPDLGARICRRPVAGLVHPCPAGNLRHCRLHPVRDPCANIPGGRAGSTRSAAEFNIVANNLLLTVILGVVFIGTLYPLLVEAMSGEKLSVGAPYFNAVAGPLAILLGILLAMGPLLSWRHERRPVLKKLALPGLFAATALTCAVIAIPEASLLAKLGLALAAGLIPAALLPLIGRNPLRTPLATWGMAVAHLGAAVSIAGMAADTAFSTEKLTAARPGDIVDVGPWASVRRGDASSRGQLDGGRGRALRRREAASTC